MAICSSSTIISINISDMLCNIDKNDLLSIILTPKNTLFGRKKVFIYV